jgi:hypothetical protein
MRSSGRAVRLSKTAKATRPAMPTAPMPSVCREIQPAWSALVIA